MPPNESLPILLVHALRIKVFDWRDGTNVVLILFSVKEMWKVPFLKFCETKCFWQLFKGHWKKIQ